jgi:hypothetical protein
MLLARTKVRRALRSAFVLQAIADLAYGTPFGRRRWMPGSSRTFGARAFSNLGSVRTWSVFPTR